MIGGFPCQDVSAAGLRAGIADGTRSGLWAMFAKAIAALRPKAVVIENVRGLLSAQAHRAMEPDNAVVGGGTDGPVLRAAGAVLGDLADLGYDAQWVTVSAASVGAPHERFRVFILAVAADAGDAADIREWARSGLGQRNQDAANTEGHRRHEGWPESAGVHVAILPTPAASRSGRNRSASPGAAIRPSLDSITHLLPTPAAADGDRGADFARANRDGSGGDDLVTTVARATREPGTRWGKYEPAIRRWEERTRPAPAPTEPNAKGNPRLAPPFPEWMQGWPAGWVTAVPGVSRNDQLRLIGNGVCPQQAIAALRWLIQIWEVAA